MSLFSQQVLFNNSILSILPILSIPIAQCRVNVRRLEHKHKNNQVNSNFFWTFGLFYASLCQIHGVNAKKN